MTNVVPFPRVKDEDLPQLLPDIAKKRSLPEDVKACEDAARVIERLRQSSQVAAAQ
jgi:hypothetical protein